MAVSGGIIAVLVIIAVLGVSGLVLLALYVFMKVRKQTTEDGLPGAAAATVPPGGANSTAAVSLTGGTAEKDTAARNQPNSGGRQEKSVAVVIGVRSGQQSGIPRDMSPAGGLPDKANGKDGLSESMKSPNLSWDAQAIFQDQEPGHGKPSVSLPTEPPTLLKAKIQAVNSNSSIGSALERTSALSLQAFSEEVADRARRKASDEASICRKPSDETQPAVSIVPSLAPKACTSSAAELEVQRARSISAVVAAKQRQALAMKRKSAGYSKASRHSEGGQRRASAPVKKMAKRERSLSLPMISVERDGRCSFLLSDPGSSDSDTENRTGNSCKDAAMRRPGGQGRKKAITSCPRMPVIASPVIQTPQSELWQVQEVSSRVIPATGAVEIVDLIHSDPGDCDSTEEDSLFVASPAMARAWRHDDRDRLGRDSPGAAFQSGLEAPAGQVQQRRVLSLQHMKTYDARPAATTCTAKTLAPPPEGHLQRGSRFKRSRRSSQKQRVRVVGRAVTFHSHSGPPTRTPASGSSNTPGFPAGVPPGGAMVRRKSSSKDCQRRASVVEMLHSETQDESSTASVGPERPLENKLTVSVPAGRTRTRPSLVSSDRVPVPDNSPASDSDTAFLTGNGDPTADAHVFASASKACSHQRRQQRDMAYAAASSTEALNEPAVRCYVPSPDGFAARAITVTIATPSGDEVSDSMVLDSSADNHTDSPLSQSSAAQAGHSSCTGPSVSPASLYSDDKQVGIDVYCSKSAQGSRRLPGDLASSTNTLDTDSAV
ncbi:uncharacterized protein LOC135817820 [Sycon ciliatum]|uniref:uncharacterized protein LOC135817820 n=1 Tax=Sycon ciliatum TaxID=27933 RepID=UPI0031F646B6